MIRNAILALAAILSFDAATHAEIIITIAPDGNGNVVATGNGTINTTALTLQGTSYGAVSGIYANIGFVGLGPPSQGGSPEVEGFSGPTGPSSFGNGAEFYSRSGTGPPVGLNATFLDSSSNTHIPYIFLPIGYVSGTSLSDSDVWDNATISSLGLTPGTYMWTWGSGATADSFVVAIVPEPSSFILLGLTIAFVGFGVWMHRRPRLEHGIPLGCLIQGAANGGALVSAM